MCSNAAVQWAAGGEVCSGVICRRWEGNILHTGLVPAGINSVCVCLSFTVSARLDISSCLYLLSSLAPASALTSAEL